MLDYSPGTASEFRYSCFNVAVSGENLHLLLTLLSPPANIHLLTDREEVR